MALVTIKYSNILGIYSIRFSHKNSCSQQNQGTFLVAQWLSLQAPKAEGPGSIPGQGTTTPCCN